MRPSPGNISSGFGMRNGRMHMGEDIGWAAGTKLVAPITGKVVFAGTSGGYGNLLKIVSGVTEIRLGHMASFAVKSGDTVNEGDYVGQMGATGNADGVHVHWEVIVNGVWLNPAEWLKNANNSTGVRQQYLNNTFKLGLVVDNIQGPKTTAAIVNYQKTLGVTADGIWGAKTEAAHKAYVAKLTPKPKPAPASVSGKTTASFGRVDSVQRRLKKNYPLYASRLVVDNIDGPATRAAVKEFQRRSGLVVDGIAGPATRKALGI